VGELAVAQRAFEEDVAHAWASCKDAEENVLVVRRDCDVLEV
jgi:hypothetical protein